MILYVRQNRTLISKKPCIILIYVSFIDLKKKLYLSFNSYENLIFS